MEPSARAYPAAFDLFAAKKRKRKRKRRKMPKKIYVHTHIHTVGHAEYVHILFSCVCCCCCCVGSTHTCAIDSRRCNQWAASGDYSTVKWEKSLAAIPRRVLLLAINVKKDSSNISNKMFPLLCAKKVAATLKTSLPARMWGAWGYENVLGHIFDTIFHLSLCVFSFFIWVS